MRTAFRYEVTALLRDRTLLGWTLAFSLVLSLMFMAMFQNLDKDYSPEPVAFGIVKDAAYEAAPGLGPLVDAASAKAGQDATNAEGKTMPHVINPVEYSSADAARAASESGEVAGYIAVEGRQPSIFVTAEGNKANATRILRTALDSYVQRIAELESLTTAGAQSQQIGDLVMSELDFTSTLHPTANAPDSTARYYMSLLGFSCGMGIMVSMTSVRRVLATTSPLGARRTIAGLPR